MEISTLKQSFTGDIILPGDPEYEKAGSSPFYKGKPAVVVRPKITEDITAAISFARKYTMPLAIRSGGHSVAGFSTNDNGMVISMAHFSTTELKDPMKGLARVGSGAVWGDVADTLKRYNMALSSGDTKSVGVGGLTLGGGIGWLVRKFGLAIDSLVGAEIVTADGKVLYASESENADLFWAIRGGGGNFGVVTWFDFKVHKIGQVYSGMIMYTLDNLKDLIKGWTEYMRTAEEDLTTSLMIMPEFTGNPPGALLLLCYNGTEAAGKRAIEPLMHIGSVTTTNIQVKDYADVLEEAHPPEGIRVIVNNAFVETMTDEVIDYLANTLGKPATPFVQMRSLGGAMAQVPQDSTAFAHRNSEVWLMVPTFVPVDAADDVIDKALVTWKGIQRFSCGAYSCFISDSKADISTLYPLKTYQRLLEVKKKYDPENIFNQNFNIV